MSSDDGSEATGAQDIDPRGLSGPNIFLDVSLGLEFPRSTIRGSAWELWIRRVAMICVLHNDGQVMYAPCYRIGRDWQHIPRAPITSCTYLNYLMPKPLRLPLLDSPLFPWTMFKIHMGRPHYLPKKFTCPISCWGGSQGYSFRFCSIVKLMNGPRLVLEFHVFFSVPIPHCITRCTDFLMVLSSVEKSV